MWREVYENPQLYFFQRYNKVTNKETVEIWQYTTVSRIFKQRKLGSYRMLATFFGIHYNHKYCESNTGYTFA